MYILIRLITSYITKIGVIHHQWPAKTTNTVQQTVKTSGLSVSGWHMQTFQTSEFLHRLSHFSGSGGSWDFFHWRWHPTAISGILLCSDVLSRPSWGCFLCLFLLLLLFPYLLGRPSWMCSFDTAFSNFRSKFRNIDCLTLQCYGSFVYILCHFDVLNQSSTP